jgi:hypothetical protein
MYYLYYAEVSQKRNLYHRKRLLLKTIRTKTPRGGTTRNGLREGRAVRSIWYVGCQQAREREREHAARSQAKGPKESLRHSKVKLNVLSILCRSISKKNLYHRKRLRLKTITTKTSRGGIFSHYKILLAILPNVFHRASDLRACVPTF